MALAVLSAWLRYVGIPLSGVEAVFWRLPRLLCVQECAFGGDADRGSGQQGRLPGRECPLCMLMLAAQLEFTR